MFTFLVRKIFFLWKTTPTHFRFSWMCQGHFCHFWKFLLVNLIPVCILKKIVTMNVAKTSQKFFCLSNIWKNATFIENNFFPEMARLWTFFPNRNWFQLFVYFFSKKKKFSLKDYPNSFYVFLNVPKSFLPFLNIFISKPETSLYFEKKLLQWMSPKHPENFFT